MDILEDLRTTTFSNNEAFFKKAACEIEQLRTENAALKEQVAHLKSSVQHEADCVNSAAEEINRQAAENDKLKETLAEKDAELKTERIRLAACGVVALANTPDSAAKAREMLPEYRSASCDGVARTVDREMALREQLATVTAQRGLLKDALEKLFSWVDAYAETSDTEFPAVERLCVEALASLKGE